MFDRKSKEAIKKLAKMLGFGVREYFDGEINFFDSSMYDGNPSKQPVTYEEFRELKRNFNVLLDYLNVVILEKQIRKIKK